MASRHVHGRGTHPSQKSRPVIIPKPLALVTNGSRPKAEDDGDGREGDEDGSDGDELR